MCWLLNRGKNGTSFVFVSHRRLDVKPRHESDPDKKHLDKNRKEKSNEEHKNKKRHTDDLGDVKHLDEAQNEKHPQETRKEKHLDEPKKQKAVEDPHLETDNKRQKHVQNQSEPRKERLLDEPKKMRHVDELKKEKQPEEPKKHGRTDDAKKDKHREDGRHERPVNAPQRERPSEPQREKPAEVHRPIFERWEGGGSNADYHISERSSSASDWIIHFRRGVLDSSILYPTRFPSPPRQARPPPPPPPPLIRRPSLDAKKDRSGLSRKDCCWYCMMSWFWVTHMHVDICPCSVITSKQDTCSAWCMLWWLGQVCLY